MKIKLFALSTVLALSSTAVAQGVYLEYAGEETNSETEILIYDEVAERMYREMANVNAVLMETKDDLGLTTRSDYFKNGINIQCTYSLGKGVNLLDPESTEFYKCRIPIQDKTKGEIGTRFFYDI